MSTLFALVDCNNFFVSCERLFRPALANKPVVVLSNNDGCVVSRSNEAKALGIPMGIPLFKIRDQVRKNLIQVFSSNFSLYGDLSWRVMDTLEQFTPKIEIYSIDEAFLNLAGLEHQNITDYGQRIRKTVKQWTGIPVSVGIGETKVLAKIAGHFAKKNPLGVFNWLDIKDREKILGDFPIEEIWGIGKGLSDKLRFHGIGTALELSQTREGWIQKELGIAGVRLVRELQGISCLALEHTFTPRKSVVVSRSFGKMVNDPESLHEAIAEYATRAAEKLREEQLAAVTLTVYLTTNRFKDEPQYRNATSVSLPVATNDTGELIRFAQAALKNIFRKGYRYKKAGLMIPELISVKSVQGNLFYRHNPQRSKQLMQALDTINHRMGRGMLHYAATGIAQTWRGRSEKRSPSYTTNWHEILCVL